MYEIDLPQLSPAVSVFSQGDRTGLFFFWGGLLPPRSVLSACFQLLLPILGSCLYLHSPLGGLTHPLPRSPGLTPPPTPSCCSAWQGKWQTSQPQTPALLCCPASEILFGFPPLSVKSNGWQPPPASMCSGPNPRVNPASILPFLWKPPGSPLDPLSK